MWDFFLTAILAGEELGGELNLEGNGTETERNGVKAKRH